MRREEPDREDQGRCEEELSPAGSHFVAGDGDPVLMTHICI